MSRNFFFIQESTEEQIQQYFVINTRVHDMQKQPYCYCIIMNKQKAAINITDWKPSYVYRLQYNIKICHKLIAKMLTEISKTGAFQSLSTTQNISHFQLCFLHFLLTHSKPKLLSEIKYHPCNYSLYWSKATSKLFAMSNVLVESFQDTKAEQWLNCIDNGRLAILSDYNPKLLLKC